MKMLTIKLLICCFKLKALGSEPLTLFVIDVELQPAAKQAFSLGAGVG